MFNLEEYSKYDDSSYILDRCISKIVEIYDSMDNVESNMFYKTLDKYKYLIKNSSGTVLNLKKILEDKPNVYEDIVDVLLERYIDNPMVTYTDIPMDSEDMDFDDFNFDMDISEEDFNKEFDKSIEQNNSEEVKVEVEDYDETSFFFRTLKRHGILNRKGDIHNISFDMIEDSELKNRVETMFMNRCINMLTDEDDETELDINKISDITKRSIVNFLITKKIIVMD